jgi:hypothetical protein
MRTRPVSHVALQHRSVQLEDVEPEQLLLAEEAELTRLRACATTLERFDDDEINGAT